jgi:outer membrane protein assembly factor BamB/serine/threonine protein kinase
MMEALQPGDPRVAGQFRLRARLGAGGMGRVFLGYSPAGRAVAVKVCHPEFAADPSFVRRFALEVDAARAVNGLYTAQVVDAGPDDSPPWLATSYVPGPSLLEAVGAYGPLPEPAVWRLAAGLAEALRAVHARGLVHRDLKPTNVLLATDGPRVIDFGVARALDATSLTATGITFGTPSYMSPEQAEGRPAGPASDVFALGSTLCFAAAGGTPFGDGDPPSVLDRVVRAAPALDAVPGQLRGLIAACLAKEPADRPDLAAILRACQARTPQPDDPDFGAFGGTSFWPGQVAALIAAHQAGLARAAAAQMPHGEPTGGGDLRLSRLGTMPPLAPQSSTPTSPPAHRGPGRAPGTVSRRRALAGLAVVSAAGLGAAGWALTRGGPPAAARTPGRLLWARDTGGAVSSGAAIADGVVYIGGADGVHSFEAATGRPVRTYPAGGAVTGAVTVAGSTLFAGSADHRIHAWSVAFGGSTWKHPTGGPVVCKPAVAGGNVYAGSDDHNVYALDTASGKARWHFRTGGPVRSSPEPTAVGYNSNVYVGSDDGYLYAIDYQTGTFGTFGYRYGTGSPVRSGPVTDSSGAVYFGNDRGNIYETDSPIVQGAAVIPVWETPAGGEIQGTPVTDGVGTLYAGSTDGSVYALSLSNGKPVWPSPYRAGGPILSGPALAGGILYIGSDDKYLHAINVATGQESWRYQTGGKIRSQILVADGVIYFGSLDHRVYALRA